MKRRWLFLALLVSVLALAAASCGATTRPHLPSPPRGARTRGARAGRDRSRRHGPGETGAAEPAAPAEDVSGEISIMGIWQDVEAEHFEAVLDGFREQYPNVEVTYDPAGDDLPTILTTAIEGGNPPDLAAPAQPGFIGELATAATCCRSTSCATWWSRATASPSRRSREFDGTLYGFLFKASSKSLGWYNVATYETAGGRAARDIRRHGRGRRDDQGLRAGAVLDRRRRRLDPDGPVREHLRPQRRAGPLRPALAPRDPVTGSVGQGRARAHGGDRRRSENMAGGTEGALQTDFPTSVGNVLAEDPSASMVLEGIFVPGVVESPLTYPDGYNSFPFRRSTTRRARSSPTATSSSC